MADKVNIKAIVEDFLLLKEEVKSREAKLKKYRTLLLKHVNILGTKDEAGNLHYTTDSYSVSNLKRVSQKMDEKLAEEVLKAKGIYDKYVVVKLDDNRVEAGILNGEITKDDVLKFVTVKITDVLEVEKIVPMNED